MPHFRLLTTLLLALGFLELYLLIRIGASFGFFTVITWVLIAATLGLRLLQFQSWAIMNQFQQTLRSGAQPGREMLERVVVMAGGVLLIVPGFITDLIALMCVIPRSRRLLCDYLERQWGKLPVSEVARPPDSNTIEGEFRREE